ncbi:MAG: class I SAM-dependent methyltransferase [Fibrobacteria bacterium]|nr:class I SAM-dependent methyltransferase [Fibrobacteria bacterium]
MSAVKLHRFGIKVKREGIQYSFTEKLRKIMNYYKSPKNVEQYIQSSIGFDGTFLINKMGKYLSPKSTVLELGMGEGKDSEIINATYKVTASDSSPVFVENLKSKSPDFDVLSLDAISINTNKTFDAVYSNKVLIHLARQECKTSVQRQHSIMNKNGIVLHSFWYGNDTEEYGELFSVNYNESLLTELFVKHWDILEMKRYKEMEEDDSIYVICRKK